ncbi:MAG: hypothetical protein ABUK01_11025 [Leptospirales bacterium]
MKRKITGFFIITLLTAGLAYAGNAGDKCTMDVQCGVGKKCTSGICTGGITTPIFGKCKQGDYGQKVCTNTGKKCNVDSQCSK